MQLFYPKSEVIQNGLSYTFPAQP